jgi:hypothetical protein
LGIIKNYKDIQEEFNKVISYSQNIPYVHSDRTFAEWSKNKYQYYKAFGDKLIYNCGHFSGELSGAGKSKLMKELAHYVVNL